MQVLAERGYLIPAFNSESVDYVQCAIKLARSVKAWHPAAKVCLLTDQDHSNEIFDYVKLLPYGSSVNKQANDWQVFSASPFRQTIKLEADMVVASPIDHYWDILQKKDVVISVGARDFYDNVTSCRHYRKIFDHNNLPDVYNAITYWRLSQTARQFFDYVRNIFENWNTYRMLLKFPDEHPTTDVVYAIATLLMGVENVTLPVGFGPTIVHMKKYINPLRTDNWTRELICEEVDNGLRVNTISQFGLFHYHIKEWAHV